ncbi:uncharacterized protein LOC143910590 [Arctopsyche grandis]|uniref:uncharacterized protein LOC143910590 n=1 Tax=Arctopsyche grandis TaxID=121162 RepID=UPI00406D8B55
MTGVLFVVTVPKAEHEEQLQKKEKEQPAQTSKQETQNSNDIESVYIHQFNRGFVDDDEPKKSAKEVKDAESLPAEKVLSEVLAALHIKDACWSSSRDDKHWQAMFSVLGRARGEHALRTLRDAGLGERSCTALSVLPCALHYRQYQNQPKHLPEEDDDKKSTWSAFVRSVRARQTVAQVIQQVKAEAALTFDFLFLLVVAAFVAAMGLVENSTVFLVASMLISPLMGPITAGTFGTAIRDRQLFKMGVVHELCGLFLALFIGFLFGLIVCTIDESYGQGNWPTEEILSRCDVRSLWVGVLIAVPSGAAVAISVLSDNTASLVGVAISASLLPPAVNAGLLWGMSLIHLVYLDDDTKFNDVVKTKMYSDNPAVELAVDGLISLGLTLINILCIYFAGIFVYIIKEVAPVNSPDVEFWKHDIKAARDFNKTLSDDLKSHTLQEQEIITKSMECFPADSDSYGINCCQDELYERLNRMRGNHMTWSPRQAVIRRASAKELRGLYRQFSDDFLTRKPRLSFPVNQLPGYKRLSEETVSTSTENPVEVSSQTLPSKFTVVRVDEIKFDNKE